MQGQGQGQGQREILKVYTQHGKWECPRCSKLRGSEGMLTQKILKFWVLEMPFPTISAELFFINKCHGKCSSCLFYLSLEFLVTYNLNGGKTRVKTGGLQAKGKTSTFHTSKLCYNIINVNVLVLANMQNC